MAAIASPPRPPSLRPQAGPQEAFLSTPADIAFYGGAAGGGKTFALLLEPLRHVNNPAFGAVIFRRTYPQITSQGGMWDASHQMYPHLAALSVATDLTWRFPRGAKVKFAHLQYENDIYDWQGSEIPLICFDELTHFTVQQFFYLLSRNRSTCGVRPYMRATCNPDADSWVASFIAWWIDQETGYAIPERAGVVRYFIRHEEQIHWADTRAELIARFPDAHPKSFTFIPATLQDNRVLMAADPGYLANLMAQPLVERERLLGGNWKIRPAAGNIFNRAWFEIVAALPAGGEECRFWDLAATEKKLDVTPQMRRHGVHAARPRDPDWTVGVKMRRSGGVYYISDVVAVQEGPTATDRLIKQTTQLDHAAAVDVRTAYRVRFEQEGGASGKRDSASLVELLAGYDVQPVKPQGDKVLRAKPLAAQAEAGNVKLLAGPWNEAFLTQLHNQPLWPHDDMMDAASGAFTDLCGAWALGALDDDTAGAIADYSGW